MAFTGLGAGTELDPYQITTVDQFKEMNGYGALASGATVFTGTGYNDMAVSPTTNRLYTGNGATTYTITVVSSTEVKWKQGNGAETTITLPTAGDAVNLSDNLRITFGHSSGYTIGDVWVITINLYYWKLMNNIDFAAESSFYITTFNGYFDGNNYELQNLITGYGGIGLKDNASFKNTTFRFTRKSVQSSHTVLKTQYRTLANVQFANVHIIVTGTSTINYISADNWGADCTINNIVVEGSIYGCFTSTISCLIDGVKMLRPFIFASGGDYAAIVGELDAEMRNCQAVIPNATATSGQHRSYLANTINSGAKFKECFVIANVDVTYSGDSNVTHGMSAFANGTQGTHMFEDCYFKGNLSVNRGERPISDANNYGKSGFTFSPTTKIKGRRCYSSGDVNTPLNNNRTILFKEVDTANNHIENCYYNKTKLSSITPKDIAGQQTGLTSAEFTNPANFVGWDFVNVWEMGADGPVLRNNPLYAFELDPRLIAIQSITRDSASQITILLDSSWDFDTYGIDVLLGATPVYNAENTLSNPIPVDNTADQLYIIKLYWLDGGSKNYVHEETYQHYCQNGAVDTTTVAIDAKVALSDTIDANLIHGSCIYNGYVYGSTRNKQFPTQTGSIVRALLTDITDFDILPVYTDSEGVGISYQIDQIVRCGNYLYALATRGGYTGTYLIQYNPTLNDYKIFKLGSLYNGSAPIFTDGQYLYLTYNDETHKVNPAEFIGSYPKFNTSSIFSYTKMASYDHNSQGGHILGGYTPNGKGHIHSACADSEFIYLAFTTQRDSIADTSGYASTLDKTLFELHKVNKNTMVADSWVKIPKATDDMCQTATHLFFGIEVQAVANANTYGYGWGCYAIRKSDLRITGLPKLHSNDNPPTVRSYASLIFGNYLLDTKTNMQTHIIDISDVDNWSVSESVGKRTLKCYKYTWQGVALSGTPNEFLLSEAGHFYAFLWQSPSELMQVDLTGLSFFTVPTVNTISGVVNGPDVNLTGYILNTGGKTVTSKGFRYGDAPGNLTNEVLSVETTLEFHAALQGLPTGTYYYQAFAINSEGESTADIKSFTIGSNLPIYFEGIQIQKIMFNGVELTIA